VSRRITRTAALALAIAATAVPGAQAQDRITPDAVDAGQSAVVDRATPDAIDAGRPEPKVDLVSPDARDDGRREPAPIVVSEPVPVSDAFDWVDAGLGAAALALLLAGYGAAITVRTRRHTAGA
jgi:hypothetical protein